MLSDARRATDFCRLAQIAVGTTCNQVVPKILTFATILFTLGMLCASFDNEFLNQIFAFAAMIV
jgi:hypothetical protein